MAPSSDPPRRWRGRDISREAQMRRRHWWGAAAGIGLLASVALAPAANAAPAPSRSVAVAAAPAAPARPVAKPKPKPKPKPQVVAKHRGHHHHKPPQRACPYPANATPSVAIQAPSHGHWGRTITVQATVSLNNCDCTGFSAGLYASKDGKNWKLISTGTTGAGGKVSLGYYFRTTTYFRIVVAGSKGAGPSQSQVVKVVAK